jgi:ribonuclease I
MGFELTSLVVKAVIAQVVVNPTIIRSRDPHNIPERLLKVALNIINPNLRQQDIYKGVCFSLSEDEYFLL